MPKRSGFKSSIQEFLTKSNDEVLGELTKFQEGSVEITQRDAWQDQIDLLKEITKSTNIPVIASGGVGTLDHLYDGIVKGGASAVLAASIFHYGEYKIKDAKEYLNSKNVSVRL